jgi:DNA-binding PadR family transcriptional regulator
MRDANPVRLLILGLLAEGPLHGHQIRRAAELSGIEQWGGVKVGALYGMLHRLEAEGLIEPVRVEQEGRRPKRTVYAITSDGFEELDIHRDRALTQPALHSTTVEAALKWSAGLDHGSLRERLARRRNALEAAQEELLANRELHYSEGHLSTASLAGYRRTQLHLDAELAWHDELDAMLPDIASESARGAEPGRTSNRSPSPSANVTPLRGAQSKRSGGAS